MRLLSSVKQKLVPAGIAPRVIQSGPFRGLKMELNLRGQTQVYLGLFEREVHPWVTELSQGIHTAIDIGSAQGEYLLYFLSRTPAKQVLGFEPDEACWPALRRNLALNALTDDPRLSLSNQFISASNDHRHVSLDALLLRIGGPCLIKMDVDGIEHLILRGGASVLSCVDSVLVEINDDFKEQAEQSSKFLKEAGLTLHRKCSLGAGNQYNQWWIRADAGSTS